MTRRATSSSSPTSCCGATARGSSSSDGCASHGRARPGHRACPMTAAARRPPRRSRRRSSSMHDQRRSPVADAAARAVLDRIEATELDAIDRAAELFAQTIAADGLVHVFGSGHSRMNTEEMFPRIGSFPGFHPIAELAISNHVGVVGPNGLRQAMFLEKVDGFGKVILQQVKLHPGDAFLIFSSTGINGVVIEVALYAKAMGLPVAAVTSLDHSHATSSRHQSGRKLADIADIVIDNASLAGDAGVAIEGLAHRVGPTSSIGAIAVVNMLKTRTAERLVAL